MEMMWKNIGAHKKPSTAKEASQGHDSGTNKR